MEQCNAEVMVRYLTTSQAADELGIAVSTLQSWAAKGLVRPAWRTPGGQARWDVDDLERQLDLPSGGAVHDPRAPLRPAIVAAIVTSKRGVLVERRHDGQPLWTFPAGEIEPGESPADAAVREAKEETGLLVKVSHSIGERNPHPVTGRHMIYLAARPYQGTDVHNGDEAELAEVRWVTLAELSELMPDMFQPVRDHLERVLK